MSPPAQLSSIQEWSRLSSDRIKTGSTFEQVQKHIIVIVDWLLCKEIWIETSSRLTTQTTMHSLSGTFLILNSRSLGARGGPCLNCGVPNSLGGKISTLTLWEKASKPVDDAKTKDVCCFWFPLDHYRVSLLYILISYFALTITITKSNKNKDKWKPCRPLWRWHLLPTLPERFHCWRCPCRL